MNSFRFNHPTIVCPECKNKQTGIIRRMENEVEVDPYQETSQLIPGYYFIRCCICKYIIKWDEFDAVTRPVVKFPADIKKVIFLT
ncbi:MAG: hypothetical protein WBP45_11125 [Daejeonella sp.]